MTTTFDLMLSVFDLVFVVIFACEAVLKITAFNFQVYIRDRWNLFDFTIVMLGFVTFIPVSETGAINLNVIRLFRFCRIFRLLRLLKHAKRIRILFLTLVYASSSLLNVGILLFVIFFIYAVIGISVFGEKACGFQAASESIEDEAAQCADNGDKANFSSFGLALSLLYRVATEDGWSDLYDQYLGYMEGDEWVVRLFFLSFFLFGTMVLVNLFIGVILEDFENNQQLVEKEEKIQSVFNWRDVWKEIDGNANGWILASEFLETLKFAEKPAGLGLQYDPNLPERTNYCDWQKGFEWQEGKLVELDDKEVYKRLSDYIQDCEESNGDLALLTSEEWESIEEEIAGASCCWGPDIEDAKKRLASTGDVEKQKEDKKVWMVEFSAAKLAICKKILTDLEILNKNSIILKPQAGTMRIDDWFFKYYLPSRGLHDLRWELVRDEDIRNMLMEDEEQEETFVEELETSFQQDVEDEIMNSDKETSSSPKVADMPVC